MMKSGNACGKAVKPANGGEQIKNPLARV